MRRPLCALALVLAGLCVPARASSVTYSEYAVRYWASIYNINPDWLWGVVLCESSGNPYAVGPDSSEGRPYGLAQIKPQTWAWLLQAENADMTLAPHLTRYDPEWRSIDADDGAPSAHLLAWAMAHHLHHLWQCVR